MPTPKSPEGEGEEINIRQVAHFLRRTTFVTLRDNLQQGVDTMKGGVAQYFSTEVPEVLQRLICHIEKCVRMATLDLEDIEFIHLYPDEVEEDEFTEEEQEAFQQETLTNMGIPLPLISPYTGEILVNSPTTVAVNSQQEEI